MARPPLPIDAVLPELIGILRQQTSAVLRAPTGAGKTTRVPPALLDLLPGRILVLEPRRLAARAAARRMSQEAGTPLGGLIGYHVRFDKQFTAKTRILCLTPGILLRMLQDDPYLEAAGAVLFDEFHERGLESDLALGLVRLAQQTVRLELRVLVMSATLEVETVAAYLGQCPILASEGRLHPVSVRWAPPLREQSMPLATAQAVERLLEQTPGDILAFLAGMAEIRQTARHLAEAARAQNLLVLPLHGDLPPQQQDAALTPQAQRKVVLATNVAETSVTVEGITCVVDSGQARVLRLDLAMGLDRLAIEPISRAAADQRAGRAGRTQPGVCIRLWSEASHRGRLEQTPPEIRRVDVAGPILFLLARGETDLAAFPWFERPSSGQIEQALTLLRRLGAWGESGVTPMGQVLARLPVHPRLGRLLVEGQRYGVLEHAALAAALLAERDPLGRGSSDFFDRIEQLEAHARGMASAAELNRDAADQVLRVRDQLLGEARPILAKNEFSLAADEGLRRALLAAFPDRLARRRESGSPRGVMVGGRGVKLLGSSAQESELFLCIDVDAGDTEAQVRSASTLRREWLPPDMVAATIEASFDDETERVVARKILRFEDLVIEESVAALPEPAAVQRVLVEAAAKDITRVLPAEDSPAHQFLSRIRCLREWMPELELAAFAELELRELLPWVCQGCRSFAEVRDNWLEQLKGRLTPRQQQAVEREAPERLEVPSGSRLALRYEEGRPPVLAVRIQEMFGLAATPRVAGGRVKVLLHLLAPNHRPQQVTDDLASFWANTYPQVRKELRARYPKHAWPEDPLAALPQSRPSRGKNRP